MTTVVFLSGRTMGDALGATGRAFRKAFEQQGFDFLEINLAEPSGLAVLNKAAREMSVEFVFSFAGIGIDLRGARSEGEEMNLWEAMQVPFISLNGDSPAYFFDRHVMPGSSFACFYGFPEHHQLRKRLPLQRGMTGVGPHVVLHPTPKASINFASKEKGRLLFLKNGNDPEQLFRIWREVLSDSMFLLIADLAAELSNSIQTDLGNDIDSLVVRHFERRGMDIEELTKLRLFFTAQLDDYLRRLKSTFLVNCLLDFPIEVHGFNWDHIDFTNKRATLVPFADYTRSTDLIKGALGLLDMSPNTGLAPHDRPMRAYGMHTLCLTNEQAYFTKRFANHRVFSFRFDRDHIREIVSNVLARPRQYVELGISIAEQIRNGHEPDDFARFMLDVASTLRLETAARHPSLQDFVVWPPGKLG